jgi:nucleotide-binding universal stress UspA family protein
MIKKNDKVYLLTVGNKHPTWFEMRPMSDQTTEIERKNQEEVKKVLSFYARKIRDLEMEVTLIGCTGTPGSRICEVVKALNISRVVIGRRSSGFLRSLVSPSTSRHVCDYADCEVILAKEKPGSVPADEAAFSKMMASEVDGSLVVKAMALSGDENSPFSVYALTEKGAIEETPKIETETEEKKLNVSCETTSQSSKEDPPAKHLQAEDGQNPEEVKAHD